MRKLLLINPNTSESVSALLQQHAQKAAGPETAVHTVTARFGAPYIACEASYAVACHVVLDAWAEAFATQPAGFDAVLIGCFGDPGLTALRECCGVPVTGLAEASFLEGSQLGRFAIVTGGVRWKPILQRLADSLGMGKHLAGITTVEQSGSELARDPVAAHTILARACMQALDEYGVDAIILGGAGLAGMAEAVQAQVPVPVIDSVSAGVRYAMSGKAAHAGVNRRFDFPWLGLSPALTSLGTSP
jgi:Asp/Glu/hydantoin racemase